jgi:hypothetical protein
MGNGLVPITRGMEAVMITERIKGQIQETDEERKLDRRGMLTAMAVTAAGLVGAAALPTTALAAHGDPVSVGVAGNGAANETALWGKNVNAGYWSIGVLGESKQSDGIRAMSEAPGLSGLWAKNVAVGGVGATADGALAGLVGRTPLATGYGVIALGGVGKALKVDGKATFTRSGIATFPKKKNVITVTVPGDLTTGVSMILATMQGSPGDGVYISYAGKNTASTIKIRLNKKSTKKTTVAWFVID